MDIPHVALLFSASFGAGMVNALAGGGSLVSLPVLLGLGLPPATAAATNAVAAWIGLLGGSVACRETLAPHARAVAVLGGLSIVGGALGGAAMLATPRASLEAVMPWLLLAATLAFLVAPLLRFGPRAGAPWTLDRPADLAGWRGGVHLFTSFVTGYFNPAGGVAMVAAFQVFGIDDLRLANALKIFLGMLMTGASVVVFVALGAVDWPRAAVMMAGTLIGGYAGAALAFSLDRRVLRGMVLAWGGAVSATMLMPM